MLLEMLEYVRKVRSCGLRATCSGARRQVPRHPPDAAAASAERLGRRQLQCGYGGFDYISFGAGNQYEYPTDRFQCCGIGRNHVPYVKGYVSRVDA